MKIFKRIILAVLILIGTFVLAFGIYFGVMEFSYYRIGDVELQREREQTQIVQKNTTLSVVTYNIGFGAYDRDYSFFMDEGEMADGTKTQGKYGKGVSKENTLINTNGSIATLENLNADFMMIEEVDEKASRSYNVNQKQMLIDTFDDYGYTFAQNFHSLYMAYPLNDMHGYVYAGLLTMSKYKMDYSYRYGLPISNNLITRMFDLDRCINLVRYKVDGTDKYLTMITVHLSAYDEGGVFRAQQIALLMNLITEEYNAGNYVVVGGDFNHDLPGNSEELYAGGQKRPNWLQVFPNDELPEHFSLQCDSLNPSCRDSDLPYTGNESIIYQSIVDGFIVSDNITVSLVKTVTSVDGKDTNYLYSDHNPVYMEFKLK